MLIVLFILEDPLAANFSLVHGFVEVTVPDVSGMYQIIRESSALFRCLETGLLTGFSQ